MKAGENKTLPFTNYAWDGHKIKVCADGGNKVEEAGKDNNCYIPTFGFKFNYDFAQYASHAGWRGSAGWIKYADGESASGQAVKLTEVVAEDNRTYRSVIGMAPPRSGYGWLEGTFGDWQEQWQSGGYMLPLELPYNARFTARVGLPAEARGGDAVNFLFGIQNERGGMDWWPAVAESNDGSMTDMNIDLSAYGGQKVMAVLRVEAGAGPGDNYALWIAPRISQ